MSIIIYQHLSTSINIYQNQSTSINIYQYLSLSIQYLNIPISKYSNLSISLNISQHLSISLNISQYHDMTWHHWHCIHYMSLNYPLEPYQPTNQQTNQLTDIVMYRAAIAAKNEWILQIMNQTNFYYFLECFESCILKYCCFWFPLIIFQKFSHPLLYFFISILLIYKQPFMIFKCRFLYYSTMILLNKVTSSWLTKPFTVERVAPILVR